MYLILFFGAVFLFAFVLVKVTAKGKKDRYDNFLKAVKEGALKAVPESAGCRMAMAQGAKDAVSTVKGYDRIQTGYASLPNLIVCYREEDIYIMAVPCPSVKSMEVDMEFILHITKDMLEKVKLGPMGKVAFYFKDSKRFFVMTVTDYAIPLVMQPEEKKEFRTYIKQFAERVNG